ncbi:glycosyltransferase family 2 protein [Roseivivax marinus]|uniref:glycosyltransferase family 2 protein n=1 Tax=Roseivivax marinus TaxID=1379903 RepID=UPI001F034022|nr:glycosyltransferase family A protein [Roseivivax marinus]UMA63310.1 glycosyltransferase family 2 protein [Roseivivax marinus]
MSRQSPEVSIILPVYNRESTLGRALDSLTAQHARDIEIIVVDDGSSDGSRALAEACAARDPRIMITQTPRNLGAAGARNVGIGLASGRYVAFQDSDDRWFPEKLTRQLEALRESPTSRACYCGAVYFSTNQSYYIPRQGTNHRPGGNIFEDLLASNATTPQTLLVERGLLSECGDFDENLFINEDWDLALRIARRTSFTFVPDPLVMIYRTSDSVSSDRSADAIFREWLLETYASDYARHRRARARQRYIAGAQHLALGNYRRALRLLVQSMRDTPSPRCAAQIARIPISWLRGRRPA